MLLLSPPLRGEEWLVGVAEGRGQNLAQCPLTLYVASNTRH